MSTKAKMKVEEGVSFEEMHDRLEAFDSIVVPHPRMTDVAKKLDSLMEQTKRRVAGNEQAQSAAGNRPIQPKELWVQPIIGPSGATKSTSLEKYIETVNCRPNVAADQSPILLVKIRSSTKTPKAIQLQILERYGDQAADIVKRAHTRDYSETLVNKGLRNLARANGTLIVALDEAHKMLRKTDGPMVKTMADMLQSLVGDAAFSLAIVGTKEALRLFVATSEHTSELTSRKKETLNLAPFDVTKEEDRAYFFSFIDFLEDEMVKNRVLDSRIGLVRGPAERAVMFDIAGGVVGIVCRVIRLALERAFEAGRGHVTWDDLADGFRGWKREQEIEEGVTGRFYDPFNPKNGGARWETLKHVNKDFPESERIKKSGEAVSDGDEEDPES